MSGATGGTGLAGGRKDLKPFLIPFLMGIAVVLAFLGWSLRGGKTLLVVVNQTGMALLGGEVRLSREGRSQELGRLGTGDTLRLEFPVTGDNHFVADLRFEDGTRMRDSAGYVTPGIRSAGFLLLSRRGDSLSMDLVMAGPPAR